MSARGFDVAATLRILRRRYGRAYGATGVGFGPKQIAGEVAARSPVIHFYVKAKSPLEHLEAKPLPRYVLARDARGRSNRRRRLPTDIIATGVVTPVSRAGSAITSLNERGTISFVFADKTPGATDRYMLTCAHVVGDMRNSPPVPDWVKREIGDDDTWATTIYATSPQAGSLTLDVALARVSPDAEVFDCEVDSLPAVRLSGVTRAAELRLLMPVGCALATSGRLNGRVMASLAIHQVEYRGIGDVDVENLFLIDVQVAPGDSGGPVYAGDKLVGFVVARGSEGGAWCHLAEQALDHVRAQAAITLTPFAGG